MLIFVGIEVTIYPLSRDFIHIAIVALDGFSIEQITLAMHFVVVPLTRIVVHKL